MWNLSADCTLLALHLEIILTNLEPLQPYFICSNCICSLITITITTTISINVTITLTITLTTTLMPEALFYLLHPVFASSPSPRPSQFTHSLHEALSQPSSLLLTVFKFIIVRINRDWFTGRLNRFGSSSTLSRCKDARVHWSFTLDRLFLLLLQFLRLRSTHNTEYIKTVQG